MQTSYRVEIEQEEDGRFLAEVVDLPGVMAYGETADLALAHVQALALRVLAESREDGAYAAHAHRLESDLWEVLILPL